MSGTGNLILKNKSAATSNSAAGTPAAAALAKAMPAVQLPGLSQNTSTFLATANYPNRLWMGMNGDGSSTYSETGTVVYAASGTAYPTTRALWMGAEIRAAAGVQGSILKADWTNPSDYVLVTQKAIKDYITSSVGGQPKVFSYTNNTFTTLVTDRSIEFRAVGYDTISPGTGVPTATTSGGLLYATPKIYFPDPDDAYFYASTVNNTLRVQGTSTDGNGTSVYLKWAPATQGFAEFVENPSNDVALLGSPGATKGAQSFLSPILIEQKLTLNAFSVNSVEQPATIHSESIDASIFDLNVETITIGGSAISIDIGNDSTANDTTTTIYGDFVVTGNSFLGVIDGGSF